MSQKQKSFFSDTSAARDILEELRKLYLAKNRYIPDVDLYIYIDALSNLTGGRFDKNHIHIAISNCKNWPIPQLQDLESALSSHEKSNSITHEYRRNIIATPLPLRFPNGYKLCSRCLDYPFCIAPSSIVEKYISSAVAYSSESQAADFNCYPHRNSERWLAFSLRASAPEFAFDRINNSYEVLRGTLSLSQNIHVWSQSFSGYKWLPIDWSPWLVCYNSEERLSKLMTLLHPDIKRWSKAGNHSRSTFDAKAVRNFHYFLEPVKRKAKKSSLSMYYAKALALYAAAFDNPLFHYRLLALWQLAEHITCQQRERMAHREIPKRIASFVPARYALPAAIRVVLEGAAEARNEFVHSNSIDRVNEDITNTLQVAVDWSMRSLRYAVGRGFSRLDWENLVRVQSQPSPHVESLLRAIRVSKHNDLL